jgi:hypothetical protein
MTPEFLSGFLRAGIFITLISLVLILIVRQGSAEFIVSICSLGIGLALVGLIALVTWLGKR